MSSPANLTASILAPSVVAQRFVAPPAGAQSVGAQSVEAQTAEAQSSAAKQADPTQPAARRGRVIPGPILLIGAPGVGKGTQAKAIMAAWEIPQISTGDLLRANVSRGTELGRLAKETMDRGELVSDELVNQMVALRLLEPDTAAGYILDGFPRTLGQAQWLDVRLGEPDVRLGEPDVRLGDPGLRLGSSDARPSTSSMEDHTPVVPPLAIQEKRPGAFPGGLPVIAVSIRVSYTQLLRRITGRRSCPTCQRIYNIYLQPPKVDMVCDVDGTSLVGRADDTEAVFEERMRTYGSLTTPVVEHYRALGRFAEVDGEEPVEAVTAAILAAVEELRTSGTGQAGQSRAGS